MNDKPQQPDTTDDEPATLFERVTRRSFLTRVGAAGVAVSTTRRRRGHAEQHRQARSEGRDREQPAASA